LGTGFALGPAQVRAGFQEQPDDVTQRHGTVQIGLVREFRRQQPELHGPLDVLSGPARRGFSSGERRESGDGEGEADE
jgi:hypothetical protein